ncbi:hypothetical protein ACFQOZ_07710 [Comamonas endophytica]|uniref:hypothetical protein n=1 Tax=Comamonas endophytica TaxID=2949090 RepID=UPI0036245D84
MLQQGAALRRPADAMHCNPAPACLPQGVALHLQLAPGHLGMVKGLLSAEHCLAPVKLHALRDVLLQLLGNTAFCRHLLGSCRAHGHTGQGCDSRKNADAQRHLQVVWGAHGSFHFFSQQPKGTLDRHID